MVRPWATCQSQAYPTGCAKAPNQSSARSAAVSCGHKLLASRNALTCDRTVDGKPERGTRALVARAADLLVNIKHEARRIVEYAERLVRPVGLRGARYQDRGAQRP